MPSMGKKLGRIFGAAALACVVTVSAVPQGVAAERKLTFKRTSSQSLPFGVRLAEPYVVDVFDIDGDGADDFAVTGMGIPERKANILNSFIVRNDVDNGKFLVTDLGDDGKTRNASSGEFYRDPDGGVFFVLGRNGELFAPGVGRNTAESVSIFKLSVAGGALVAESMFVDDEPALTASVDSCDIDHDGITEILVNNYTDYQARVIRREDGVFYQYPAKQWVFMLLNAGAHNALNFDDIDGDGACDMMAAYEVPDIKTFGPPGVYQSFVSLNADGRIGKSPMLLPNPAFGKSHAGFDMRFVEMNGERLVFLTAAEFTGFGENGWNKYTMQVFSFDGKTFTEVTKQKLDKQLPVKYAGQKDIRFHDIDHDGDLDIYLSQYTDEIAIYRNMGDRFKVERIRKADGDRNKAVAFLANPTRDCSDMVVVHRDGTLERYECK